NYVTKYVALQDKAGELVANHQPGFPREKDLQDLNCCDECKGLYNKTLALIKQRDKVDDQFEKSVKKLKKIEDQADKLLYELELRGLLEVGKRYLDFFQKLLKNRWTGPWLKNLMKSLNVRQMTKEFRKLVTQFETEYLNNLLPLSVKYDKLYAE